MAAEDFLRTGAGCRGAWMEGGGKHGNEGVRPSFISGEGGRIWAKVVRGQLRRPSWMSYKIFEVEVDQL